MARSSLISHLFPVFFLSVFLMSCSSGSSNNETTDQPPNIIILFSDELQFEDIGYFGGSIPTPNIDALASEGMVFENTFTPAPMCTPSRFTLLTGVYPGRCTAESFLRANPVSASYNIGWNTHVDSTMLTIPRLLSEHGYYTGMAGKWHLSQGRNTRGLLKMADSPKDDAVNEALKKHQQLVSEIVEKNGGFDVANSVMFGNFDGFPVKALRMHNFPWMNKGAMDFLDAAAARDQPFFLYLTATSLHGPHHAEGLVRDYAYTPEGKLDGLDQYMLDTAKLRSDIEGLSSPKSHRFAGMAFLDHQVGLVLEKLKALNVDDNTVVIFLPDHNTEPAKATTYEKGIRIPMVVRWPGKIEASASVARIQTTDILPTIMDIAGVSLPDGFQTDGKSFLTVLERGEESFRKYVFAESGYTRSVSDGTYKYIAFRYPPELIDQMISGKLKTPNQMNTRTVVFGRIAAAFYPSYFDPDQLFDLTSDPYEQNNLAGDVAYQEKLEELQDVLAEHLASFSHPFDLSVPDFLYTDDYRALTEETKKLKPEDIDWYVRDWGKIVWPPMER